MFSQRVTIHASGYILIFPMRFYRLTILFPCSPQRRMMVYLNLPLLICFQALWQAFYVFTQNCGTLVIDPRNWIWFPYYVIPFPYTSYVCPKFCSPRPMLLDCLPHGNFTSTNINFFVIQLGFSIFFHAIHLIPSKDFPGFHPVMLMPSPKVFLWLPLISSMFSPHPVPAIYPKKLLYSALPMELQFNPSLDFCIHRCHSCIINKVFLILPMSFSTYAFPMWCQSLSIPWLVFCPRFFLALIFPCSSYAVHIGLLQFVHAVHVIPLIFQSFYHAMSLPSPKDFCGFSLVSYIYHILLQ